MPTTLQFRRGNSATAAGVTGANGEIYINTQTHQLIVHDGATAGGFAMQTTAGLAANVATMTANNSTNLNGQPASYYATASALSSKQDTLVSATNIKTINGTSLLGSGNITISGGGGGGVSDGGSVGTLTIGDVYYANNIVSPIPVITQTSYGNVVTHTPFVVNSPLTVLSGDTSNTTFATLSGSELSGGHSGGTNNYGILYSGSSDMRAKGKIDFTIDKPTSATINFFKNLRQGDVLTGIGTNGLYTGSFTMTINHMMYEPREDIGGQYGPDIGRHGYIQFSGILTDLTQAPNTDRSINANIFTVNRPYNDSTVNGGLKPTFLETSQVVANNVTINRRLVPLEGTYTGSSYQRNCIYHAVGSWVGGQNIQIEGYKTSFVQVNVTGTNTYPIDLGWDLYDPQSEGHAQTITLLMTADSNFTLTLPHSGANTVVAGANEDHTAFTYYYVPTYWRANSYPTQITAGRALEMTFKFVASGEVGYTGVYCDWKEYY